MNRTKKKNRSKNTLERTLPVAAGAGHKADLKIAAQPFVQAPRDFKHSNSSVEYWPTEDWKTSTPESQGMDSAVLANAIENFGQRDVHGMVVIRNGYLVAEAYFGDRQSDAPQDVRSVTKSVTSALTGIVMAEHPRLHADSKIAEWFPELAEDPLKAEIRIRHLLSMTSGLEWNNDQDRSSNEMMFSPDWIRFVLGRPSQHPPGTRFNYNNGDSHLMSAILQKVTGASLFDFAKERLFAPLGIKDVLWAQDPQGTTIGAWGMALKLRDMAKLGLLYLKEGVWNGAKIIPGSWIRESLVKRVWHNYADGRQGGYGYWWWLKPLVPGLIKGDSSIYQSFYAAGSGGPRIFVVPALQLIVALTALSPDADMPEQLLNCILSSIQSGGSA